MKYLLFNEGLTMEQGQLILDFIQSTDGPLTIGFGSGGGHTSVGNFLIDAFNNEKHRLTLIAMAGVYSMGFEVFYRYEGQKKMVFGVRGMYHLSSQEVQISAHGRAAYDEGTCQLSGLKNDRVRDLQFASLFMTEKELRKMKSGQDVFFDFERMKQIFPDVEVVGAVSANLIVLDTSGVAEKLNEYEKRLNLPAVKKEK
jgi:hypothetical protein